MILIKEIYFQVGLELVIIKNIVTIERSKSLIRDTFASSYGLDYEMR